MQPEPFPNHKITETGENLSRGVHFSAACYGESYNNVGITGDLVFTGDFQDFVAGVYDTPNRELTPNAGRWSSPDPAGASWNAYAYSTNPMGEIDPTGLMGTVNTCDSRVCQHGWRNIYWGTPGGTPTWGWQSMLAGFGDNYILNGVSVSGSVAAGYQDIVGFGTGSGPSFSVASSPSVASYDYGVVGYEQFAGCIQPCGGTSDEIPYPVYGVVGATLADSNGGDVLMAQNQPPPPPNQPPNQPGHEKVENAKRKALKVFARDMAVGVGGAALVGCGIGAPAGNAVAPGPVGLAGGCAGGATAAVEATLPLTLFVSGMDAFIEGYWTVFSGK